MVCVIVPPSLPRNLVLRQYHLYNVAHIPWLIDGILSNLPYENMLSANCHVQRAVSGNEKGILLREKNGGVSLN